MMRSKNVNTIFRECTATCLPGNLFPGGLERIQIECEEGDWKYLGSTSIPNCICKKLTWLWRVWVKFKNLILSYSAQGYNNSKYYPIQSSIQSDP